MKILFVQLSSFFYRLVRTTFDFIAERKKGRKKSESIEKSYQFVLGHSLSIRITVQLFSLCHIISRRLWSAVQQLFSHSLYNTISFFLLSSPLSPSIFLSLSVPISLILYYITLFLFLVGYHGCEEGSYQERRLYRS